MANFPTSPTTGDTFHSGSNLYSWTGTAWKIVAGDRPDYGVVTFEGQVFGTPPDVLFHFDDNLTDAVGGSSATHQNPSYPSSPISGFGKEIQVTNAASNSSATEWVTVPNPGLGTGAFTVEFYVTLGDTSSWQTICGSGGYSAGDWYLIMQVYNATGDEIRIRRYDSSIGYEEVFFGLSTGKNIGTTGRVHVVLVRSISGSDHEWRLYLNGLHVPVYQQDYKTSGQYNTNSDFHLGKSYGNCVIDGKFDELQITKSDTVYTISGTDDIPVSERPTTPGPYVGTPSAIAGKSQIYAKDVVVAGSGTGDAIYRFNGNTDDSIGIADGTVQGTPASGSNYAAYSSLSVPLASTFDQHLRVSNASLTSGDNYFSAPFPNYADNESFTIEFWMLAGSNGTQGVFGVFPESSGVSHASSFAVAFYGNGTVYLSTYDSSGNGTESDGGGSGWNQAGWNWSGAYRMYSDGSTPMRHVALVRTAVSGGTQNWRLYLNGRYVGVQNRTATGAIGGNANNRLQIGRYVRGTNTDRYLAPQTWYDEFRVTKGELYTWTSGTQTVPTAPFTYTAPSNTTELYMMDGSGTETKLT